VAAIEMRSGRMVLFHAKAVIIATGGAGRVFPFTTNGAIKTGDGMAMAYRAGVPLKDMEFVQYLSQERRSGGRHPAEQDFRLAGLVQGAAAAGSEPMSRRPYVRTVKPNWWLGQRRYVAYMVRELTSLFVGLYCVLLVVGLFRLAQGRAAWEGFVAALSTPLGVSLQLVCLALATYHSVTWFALTPKAMPLAVRGEPVPAMAIVGAHYAAWAIVSLIVLIAAGS
jgi:fumarate reductase subunit C